jgi:general secretion pathway protein D
VIQAMGRYLTKPVLTAGVPASRVTLETPSPVGRPGVAVLLKGLVESQGLEFTEDSAFYHVAPKAVEVVEGRTGGPADRRTGGPVEGALQLFTIRLKHARAADVAATVNLLFGGSGEFAGSSGLSNGTLSDELRRQNVPPSGANGPLDRRTGGPPPTKGASFGGQVTIVPDLLTNSLLVRASQIDFDVLTRAVGELDIRPLQVLIEVLIVEARKDQQFSFGTNLFVHSQNVGGGAATGQTNGGASNSAGLGEMVIRLMGLSHGDIDATLQLAQSRGDVDIVSRPVLLASNNTEARFLVGSQRPFVQVSHVNPTDNAAQDLVVQYRDVGTKLTVRPTINQDGYVSLVIQQEINQATDESAFNAPVISTREASTQVLVRDGQTIVLGGLRDEQKDRNHSGVPILSGLPLIGGLFGSTSRHKTSTELYLFLTPRILRTDADADSVTAPRLSTVEAP